MRELVLAPVEPDVTQLDTPADHPDADAVRLRGDIKVVDETTGAVVLVQAKVPESARTTLATIRALLPTVKYEGLRSEGRMSSIRYAHRTFGYRCRQPLRRRETCSSANLEVDAPALNAALVEMTRHVEGIYAAHAPDAYAHHEATVTAAVHPDWRINAGVFTSGIINETAALPYHVDRNNLAGCWSAMLVVRRYLRGGYLHVPAYDSWFGCDDGHLLIFNGTETLHGVTPFRYRATPTGAPAYRYSMVWYALNNMKACLPVAEELEWGNAHRSNREVERLDADLAEHPEWVDE